MSDYSQSKIYKIVCNETGKIYIGSCIIDLDKRLWNHKSQRDCSATQILDRNNYEILLIENYPCKTNEELRWRERYWFDNINCINKRRPIVTEEEEKQTEREYERTRNEYKRKRNHYIKSWGFNKYLGTSLNLLDIDINIFQ